MFVCLHKNWYNITSEKKLAQNFEMICKRRKNFFSESIKGLQALVVPA